MYLGATLCGGTGIVAAVVGTDGLVVCWFLMRSLSLSPFAISFGLKPVRVALLRDESTMTGSTHTIKHLHNQTDITSTGHRPDRLWTRHKWCLTKRSNHWHHTKTRKIWAQRTRALHQPLTNNKDQPSGACDCVSNAMQCNEKLLYHCNTMRVGDGNDEKVYLALPCLVEEKEEEEQDDSDDSDDSLPQEAQVGAMKRQRKPRQHQTAKDRMQSILNELVVEVEVVDIYDEDSHDGGFIAGHATCCDEQQVKREHDAKQIGMNDGSGSDCDSATTTSTTSTSTNSVDDEYYYSTREELENEMLVLLRNDPSLARSLY